MRKKSLFSISLLIVGIIVVLGVFGLIVLKDWNLVETMRWENERGRWVNYSDFRGRETIPFFASIGCLILVGFACLKTYKSIWLKVFYLTVASCSLAVLLNHSRIEILLGKDENGLMESDLRWGVRAIWFAGSLLIISGVYDLFSTSRNGGGSHQLLDENL